MRRGRSNGVRIVALLVLLVGLAGCGLTPADFLPGKPSLAQRTFAGERDAQLAQAIADEDGPGIDRQLAAGGNPNAVGTGRMTMLQFAVQQESVVGVEKLLAVQVDPDIVGYGGGTALHLAATATDGKLLDLLLAAGADVNARKTGTGETPLFASTLAPNADRVRRLLAAGANPKLLTKLKETPAHQAGRVNAGDLIVILLDAGTDPRAKNSGGATFQDYYFGWDKAILNDRAKQQRQQVADWLRSHGVPVDPRA